MTAKNRGRQVANNVSLYLPASPRIGKIIMFLAGLLLLVLALPPFFSFPRFGFWLVPLAGIYLLLLFMLPRLWLIVLPLATVALDLAPFTGRFAYNELDLVFLVTLASGLLYRRYRFRVFSPSPAIIVLFLYVAVVAVTFSGWTFFALPPRAGLDNPYYTSEYAYKVFKGMVWGIALVPMWGYLLAVNKDRAVNMLVTGMSCAALMLGMIVLWERGTLGVILSGSAWYEVVYSLLDLASSYRVTGIFSDMHTGGEAYDGVVLLLLPATLYAATYGRKTWLRIIGATAALTLAYITLVGFTRATYATFAASLVLFGLFTILALRKNGKTLSIPLGTTLAALGVGMIAAVLAFGSAGSYGLASYGVIILLAYAVIRLDLSQWLRNLFYMLAVASVVLAVNAHFTSRWVEPSLLGASLIGASLAASFFVSRRLFSKFNEVTEVNQLLVLSGILILPLIMAFGLGGTQMSQRLTQINVDLSGRMGHWRDVIESGGQRVPTQLLGNGVGSFPANYISVHPELVKNIGSFNIARTKNRDVLRLGGGQDLTFGQRVSIDPYTNYTVSVNLLAENSGSLTIALCERNLIYASNFMPRCSGNGFRFEKSDGEFQQHKVDINSKRIGERHALWRWPTVMIIRYTKADTILDIDSIELSDGGYDKLQNNSFRKGLDHWFFYNDFEHLPWHIKNTFLQVCYESGWLGLVLFFALLSLMVRTNYERHAHDSMVPMYTTGVLAVCLFGFFGSPLDSARVSWIFYFFLAAGLAKLRMRN